MNLAININKILNNQIVEWERKEFKKGWNPVAAMHTICAFANDFNNWGGGYIVIGIEEKNKAPKFPPSGLTQAEVSTIQNELLDICHRINPNYFPVAEPIEYMDKLIFIIWVFGGSDRPYSASKTLKKGSQRHSYIRRYNHTVIANQKEEQELISISANIPFDDRVNHHQKVEDIDLLLVKEYLRKTNSKLFDQVDKIKFKDLLEKLRIVEGPKENLKPKNVGLIFFNNNPEKIFLNSNIEIAEFPEGPGGDIIGEKIFSGPIHHQLNQALDYIKNKVIKAYITKDENKAESGTIYNYPFSALEEALVNAVYHRSYEIREPIEIRIHKDKIEMISFPGPDPSIKIKDLQSGNVIARRYRNRRIGEFLKEFNLTEGRGTGLPKMFKAMKDIGSPLPEFMIDDDRSYFLVTFGINPKFSDLEELITQHVPSKYPASTQQVPSKYPASTPQVPPKHPPSTPQVEKVLDFCLKKRSREEIQEYLGLKNRKYVRTSIILPLLESELLAMTIPNKPSSPKQKYVITEAGKALLKRLKKR
ncbi:putative DNA binding domain-containing protein [Candidatus Dependentiae bacterium]|nr:putative DNA binding domain-containing protein [Candidatus Dependentiae bacterium]